jgi:hypothetical protein
MGARLLISLAVQRAVVREGISSDRRQPFRPALWTVNYQIDSSSRATSMMWAISRQIMMNVFDPLHRPNRTPFSFNARPKLINRWLFEVPTLS